MLNCVRKISLISWRYYHNRQCFSLLHLISPPFTGDLNDLHMYDPIAKSWTDLSVPLSGTPASLRDSHGFTSAGGKLYVHGGEFGSGKNSLE
jgi:hypothetical protein